MGNQKRSQKELVAQINTLQLRIEELETVERKYHALIEKIERLADQIVEQDADEPIVVTPQGKDRATLLVVDDNDIFRKYLQDAIRNGGYAVYAAGSATEALHLLKDVGKAVDLMITDVVMPEGSGRVLYENVKAVYPHIKVLFVSGYTDDILVHTDVQEVMESKAAFLQKPFYVADLLKKVKQELGER